MRALIAASLALAACAPGAPAPSAPAPGPAASASASASPLASASPPRAPGTEVCVGVTYATDADGASVQIATNDRVTTLPASPRLTIDGHGVFGRVPLGELPKGPLRIRVGRGPRCTPLDARVRVAFAAHAAQPRPADEGAPARSDEVIELRGEDHEPLLFVADQPATARFVADDGEDHALANGSPAFDVRAVAAEVAGFRAAVRESLGLLGDGRRQGLWVDVDPERPRGAFLVGRYGEVVYVRVGATEPWAGPLRLATLGAVTRGSLGGSVRVEGDDGWFSGGVAHAFTAALLESWGGLEAADLAQDVNGLLLAQARGPKPTAPEIAGALAATTVDRRGHDLVVRVAQIAREGALAPPLSRARAEAILFGDGGLLAKTRGGVSPALGDDRCFVARATPFPTFVFPFDRDQSLRDRVVTGRAGVPLPGALDPAFVPGAPYRDAGIDAQGALHVLAPVDRVLPGARATTRIAAWVPRAAGPCPKR